MKPVYGITLGLFLFFASEDDVSFQLKNDAEHFVIISISGKKESRMLPLSEKKVELEEGELIYFINQKSNKKKVLLRVTSALEGKSISVNALIKKRLNE